MQNLEKEKQSSFDQEVFGGSICDPIWLKFGQCVHNKQLYNLNGRDQFWSSLLTSFCNSCQVFYLVRSLIFLIAVVWFQEYLFLKRYCYVPLIIDN